MQLITWTSKSVAAVGLMLGILASPLIHAQDPVDKRIDVFVRKEMQRQHLPGIAIGVVKNGKVIKSQGYGLANVELQVPVRPATLFQSGSLGKQFTAVAVMLQVEDGKLSLSDPLTKFFPGAPETWRAITVRHLLTHTSGIPDYAEDKALDIRKDYTEDELARFAFELPLDFSPGSRWSYSNTGYALLGIIIHKVSGSFYGDVLAARVFKPVGMTTTRIISEADIIPNRAAGYRLDNAVLKNQEWVAPLLNTTADGALYLSVQDMIAWDAGLRKKAILKPESWNLILQPVRLNSGKTYPYGFGWFLEERNGHPLQEHSGAWQGFKTWFSRYIADDLSIIALTNLADANPGQFVNGIAGIMNPQLALNLQPIVDHEPTLTARFAHLLDGARSGSLDPAQFAPFLARGIVNNAGALKEAWGALGTSKGLVLVKRDEKGDDKIFLYEVTFSAKTMYFQVGIGPDDRITVFNLFEK